MQYRAYTYASLRDYVEVYDKNALELLIIEGSAGVGKSSIVKSVVGRRSEKDYLWLEGRMTAAAFYQRLFEHRDAMVIIDDVDDLYRDKQCMNLLKCLCQTETEKRVMWNTVRTNETGTSEFKTKSKVCIITNSWKALNKHVGAVQDRGLLVLFRPDTEEVHKYVGSALKDNQEVFDQDVYDYIGENLHIIIEPSIRHYRNALQLKKAAEVIGLTSRPSSVDWKEVLIESFGLTDNEMAVLKLCKDETLSHNDRAKWFAKERNKSERTYWRVKSDLEEKGVRFDRPQEKPIDY